MLNNVPQAVNTLARNVVINHPNSYNCVMVRKRVTRTAAGTVGGLPTLGGLGVISSDDEEAVEWDLMGNAYALETEIFTESSMMDRQDANNGGIDEFRYLIEPELLPGNGIGAVLSVTVTAGAVTAVDVVAGGTGYINGQTLAFSGPGTGATAEIVVAAGVITSVTVTAGGSGYTVAPTASVNGYGFEVKKNDVMYLVLGNVRLAFEIVDIRTKGNIPPYTLVYVCNRRDDLHLAI
jgi:hypothetical protein